MQLSFLEISSNEAKFLPIKCGSKSLSFTSFAIEDPIDPKTVTHNLIIKDNIKKKKTKKDIDKEFEALSYPHETAKKYKKDTPGQNVQKEDAEAMARAMDNQRGERDRIRQAYEREMERLDNSEEKKRLKQNHERRLQGLKARQKAARERLRAQP